MQWDAFLCHLASSTYAPTDPGQYLLQKTIHEILVGCWSYQAWGRVVDALAAGDSEDGHDRHAALQLTASPIRARYATWLPTIHHWYAQLHVLQAYAAAQSPRTLIHWPTQLDAIADQIATIQEIHPALHRLVPPDQLQAREFFAWLCASIDRIHLIYAALRAHDYILIYAYPDIDTAPLRESKPP